ncbi:hypothetical protein MGLY_21100 [Neomoorella glycerini]|uniref:HD-associated domain-containing protein n=1 Tax=Neomoorella glycerini TaxID=55779 RepID=A0A6I5ZTL4_9FIRM|nr:hypothetical protein [Moorella glycerini]QGP92721.1 hypothetical protein MGLY_21100 [Moorella glycerini]
MVKEVIGRIFKPTWVVKLISSQLDADRLDYLFRDSLMTGTGYGKFDLDWLLNVLRIGMVNGDYEIGLDYEKGVKVAETFIMARYSMYLQVYYHKTTRGAEVLLDRILNRAAEVVDKCQIESGDALLKLIKGENISVSEYLDLDDNVLVALIKDWAKSEDGILSDLCTRFLHRRLFKSIDISSVSGHAIAFAEKYNRAKSICRKQFPPEYYLASDSAENSPYKDYYIFPPGGEGEKDEKAREATEQIYLFPKDLNPEELSNASDVVKALRNRKYIKERLYFPAEMREKINEIFA